MIIKAHDMQLFQTKTNRKERHLAETPLAYLSFLCRTERDFEEAIEPSLCRGALGFLQFSYSTLDPVLAVMEFMVA